MASKILVRAPNWLGDAVMATPFIKRLAARNPQAVLDVACRPGVAAVFRGCPGVQSVVVLEKNGHGGIPARVYDEAYVLPPSFGAAWAVWRARIPSRVGYATDLRRPLLTRALPLDERYHYTRRYLGLLDEAGRDIRPDDFYFPRAAPEEAAALLRENGLEGGRLLAVAPGSRAAARRWFPERFAQVINALGPEWSVALMGAPEDAPYAAAVAALVNTRRFALSGQTAAAAPRQRLADLCGRTPLPLAASVLEKASALLTNESGLMHVAWAVGTPSVVLAGPSDPQATSPFGPSARVIQHREVPCVPCVRNDCYRAGEEHLACLKKIGVQEVLAALAAVARKG